MDENRPEEFRPAHEERDVNPWAIGKFVVGLVLFCGFALLLLVWWFKFFEKETPLETIAVRTPAKIRLEETQTDNLVKLRTSEERLLTTYDWVDKQQGTVRLPIDRAIDLLAQRGLPARPPQQQQTAQRVSMPTDSSLGVQK